MLVKTGVKHAEPVVEKYVIGANDEPNGHGTVTYNKDKLEAALTGDYSYEAKKLRALLAISNTVVGDAIANMLVLEAIMYDRDESIQDFAGIYQENPYRNVVIKVADKTNFKVTEDELRLIEPVEVQNDIDNLVS